MLFPRLILLAVLALTSVAHAGRELWLYYPTNLLVDANIDRLEKIWARAAAAGYTHVLLADAKFARLGEMSGSRYFKNVDRTKAIAARLKLKLVPAVFPVGYANDLLSLDPNLAEGLPVVDTPMVVRHGVAEVVPDPKLKLAKPSFVDPSIRLDGDVATVENNPGNARIVYDLTVRPHACYDVSVDIKTDDYTAKPQIVVLGKGRPVQFETLHVGRTQGWTTHHVVFNSLDYDRVKLYFGTWSPAKGTLQWRDRKVEEAPLVNVLRRPGTPLVVRGEGERVYREGVDFDRVADPKLGTRPFGGQYTAWHEPPVLKTKLPEGTKLRVSWYHPAIIYDGQVSGCIAEPKMDQLLADQAKRMKTAWGNAAAGWMMSHDEFRTLGWCKACVESHETPGQLLAANVKRCADLLAPAPTYVWNDMFDPHHNAVPGPYYLVNGPWTDSWLGLPKDVVIMNWNHGKRAESLKFFADRGHKQIVATYYDEPSLAQTRDWVATAANDPSVVGYMYTTWENRYDELEAFAQLVHDQAKVGQRPASVR